MVKIFFCIVTLALSSCASLPGDDLEPEYKAYIIVDVDF